MIVEVDGLKIRIIDTDDRIAIHIANGDGFEPESLKIWAQMVRPGMTVLDVGAYTGLYSIIAAMRGAQVVALEPMAANFWRLGINADINKVGLNAMAIAASDYCGLAKLRFSRHTPLTTGGSLERGIKGHTDDVMVSVTTVDALELTGVGAIKIDVERHEAAVLRGAKKTIERFRPPMIIETLDDEMRNEIRAMLPSYDGGKILDNRNTLFTPR